MNKMNNFMGLMNGASNPQAMVQNMVRQNPQLNALMSQMRQSGLSPKEFTMQYAKQNNMDINPLMNMLKQRGMKF